MKNLSTFVKENIFESRKISDAELAEGVICYAHNIAWKAKDLKWHLDYATKDNPELKYRVLDMYNKNASKWEEAVQPLRQLTHGQSLLKKMKDGDYIISSDYRGKRYFKGKDVPKTDICNKEGNIRISLKKVGDSQLCSGGINDTKGIMLSCAHLLNDDEKKKLELILDPEKWHSFNELYGTITNIKTRPNDKMYGAIIQAEKDIDFLKKAFVDIFSHNIGFYQAVIREAALGEHKFGKDSIACPNYFFVWDDINPSNSKLYTAEEYLQKLYGELDIDTSTNSVNVATEKSGGKVYIKARWKSNTKDDKKWIHYAYNVFEIGTVN